MIGQNTAVHFDLIIKNGTIVTSADAANGDIGIRDGKIAEIGNLSSAAAREVLDAENLWVLPGLIDTQVHFREPGLEHKEDL